MRGIVLLAFAAIVLLPSIGATAINPEVRATGGDLKYTGGCVTTRWNPGETWYCRFEGVTRDPTLIFFRWDLNGDGAPDDPTWGTSPSLVYITHGEGVRRICLQAWDGVTYEGDQPQGPIYCRRYALGGALTIVPRTWDRNSTGGWVFAIWKVLPALRPFGSTVGLPRLCARSCVPSVALWENGDPVFRVFRAERADLTRAFGPGVHFVELFWEWNDPMNTVVISRLARVDIR